MYYTIRYRRQGSPKVASVDIAFQVEFLSYLPTLQKRRRVAHTSAAGLTLPLTERHAATAGTVPFSKNFASSCRHAFDVPTATFSPATRSVVEWVVLENRSKSWSWGGLRQDVLP